MKRYSQMREIERRVRSSLQYARWVERNRSTHCVRCGGDEDLQVHHIFELYHIISGLWKFYGEWEAVFRHTVAMHDDNRVEAVTLCDECHGTMHPGRAVAVLEGDLHVDEWCAVPRNFDAHFALGRKNLHRGEIGLLGFQTVLGLGWHLLNGQGGIVEFNRRRFAELLGKKPSVSFNAGLAAALDSVVEAGIADAWASEGNHVEVHLSRSHLDKLRANPWFVPLTDTKTSSMAALVLRWLLGFQANRSSYLIGVGKLATHMQLTTLKPTVIKRCVREAVNGIPWCEVEETGDKFRFKFKRRGMVPIHSLRATLFRSLDGR